MDVEGHYDRPFQLWAYTVSHRQLLLRGTKDPENNTRVDIVFKDVAMMLVPPVFESLTISRVQPQTMGINRSACDLDGMTVYRLQGPNFDGFVVAGASAIHEGDGEYYEPSAIYQT